MVDFLILGDASQGRIYYHQEASDRVEGKEGMALKNANELAFALKELGVPKLLVLDAGWADTCVSIIYETVGRDKAQNLATIGINQYRRGPMNTVLENYYNLVGMMPNNSDRSLALPRVISAFLEGGETKDFQAVINSIVDQFDEFDADFYAAVDARMKAEMQRQRTLQMGG